MLNDRGAQIRKAEPSTPVEVLGLDSLPEAGDDFQVVTDTAKAKQIVNFREPEAREAALAKIQPPDARATAQADEGGRGQGTADHHQDRRGRLGRSALRDAAEAVQRQGQDPRACTPAWARSTNPTCCWRRRRTRSSSASTCGRSATPQALAEQEKVDIRLHTIIYNLTDEIKKAMTGLLDAGVQGSLPGQGRGARDVPHHQGRHGGRLPWCMDGIDHRATAKSALLRDNVVVHTGKIGSLRRFKDDVSEVKSGMECGITLDELLRRQAGRHHRGVRHRAGGDRSVRVRPWRQSAY